MFLTCNVSKVIFELMAVYNSMQVLMNVYEIAAIVYDAASSDFRLDTLSCAQWHLRPMSHLVVSQLGGDVFCFPKHAGRPKNVAEPLIWLQYHCRQLELLDTLPGRGRTLS